MSSHRTLLLSLAAACALAACPPRADDAPPSYADAKPILDAKCATCHREGSIGPTTIVTHDDVLAQLDSIETVISDDVMPPWPAGDGCNRYKKDYSLTPDEKALLLRWLRDGAPGDDDRGADESQQADALGSVDDPRAPDIRPDAVLLATDTPFPTTRNDEYRCFAIAWPYDHDVYITGFDVVPGDPQNVHHVNVFGNPPPDDPSGDFVAFDEEDPDPGYGCGRGDRVLSSILIGSWGPGASGLVYPAGSGQLMAPGSSVTLEVHYAKSGGLDASQLVVQVDETVERRALGAAFWWFNQWDSDGGMRIPAGEKGVVHDVEVNPILMISVVAPWFTAGRAAPFAEVHLAAIHMHQLGVNGHLEIRNPVGDDTCLLDIPRWDYHWQMGFELEEPAYMYLSTVDGDSVYLRCEWDNTAENQPVVDGVQQEPRDVEWGPKASDEMCMGFLYLVPSDGPPL